MDYRGQGNTRRLQSARGFTLLELLAVIAIIGLLASFALPAINKIREKGRITTVKAELTHIETALDQFYAEHGTFPAMGNDWLTGDDGASTFYPSEDVGSDGQGPFTWVGPGPNDWIVNVAYTAPDPDGTEGNYRLDPGEDNGIAPWLGPNDPTADNGRLDGTFYDRLGMYAAADKANLFDIFSNRTYYHYYAAYVSGTTSLGMPKFARYSGLSDYMANHPNFYNRWVLYSVGPDGKDHGLHTYILSMQDGEDVGADGYAGDPMDNGSGTPNSVSDNDGVLFEPSYGENDDNPAALPDREAAFTNTSRLSGLVRETGWTTPAASGSEQEAPGGNNAKLEGPVGKPVFSFDVRQERRRSGQVYATPDGDPQAFGVIMRYGP